MIFQYLATSSKLSFCLVIVKNTNDSISFLDYISSCSVQKRWFILIRENYWFFCVIIIGSMNIMNQEVWRWIPINERKKCSTPVVYIILHTIALYIRGLSFHSWEMTVNTNCNLYISLSFAIWPPPPPPIPFANECSNLGQVLCEMFF